MSRRPRYTRDVAYRYEIGPHPEYYFETGRTASEQYLWGILGQTAHVLRFDESGLLVEASLLPTPGAPREAMRQVTRTLMADNGVMRDTISVRRFWLGAGDAGIEDIGEDLQEFMDNPGTFDEEERSELSEALTGWNESGMFILWWEQPFELNAEGEVVSS